ncbi:hypothetical protein HK102_013396 [Quaeritorhiza haematococci]|nr:hypothetical protein HK102_013396 [Quaeritorhiza haematococci]
MDVDPQQGQQLLQVGEDNNNGGNDGNNGGAALEAGIAELQAEMRRLREKLEALEDLKKKQHAQPGGGQGSSEQQREGSQQPSIRNTPTPPIQTTIFPSAESQPAIAGNPHLQAQAQTILRNRHPPAIDTNVAVNSGSEVIDLTSGSPITPFSAPAMIRTSSSSSVLQSSMASTSIVSSQAPATSTTSGLCQTGNSLFANINVPLVGMAGGITTNVQHSSYHGGSSSQQHNHHHLQQPSLYSSVHAHGSAALPLQISTAAAAVQATPQPVSNPVMAANRRSTLPFVTTQAQSVFDQRLQQQQLYQAQYQKQIEENQRLQLQQLALLQERVHTQQLDRRQAVMNAQQEIWRQLQFGPTTNGGGSVPSQLQTAATLPLAKQFQQLSNPRVAVTNAIVSSGTALNTLSSAGIGTPQAVGTGPVNSVLPEGFYVQNVNDPVYEQNIERLKFMAQSIQEGPEQARELCKELLVWLNDVRAYHAPQEEALASVIKAVAHAAISFGIQEAFSVLNLAVSYHQAMTPNLSWAVQFWIDFVKKKAEEIGRQLTQPIPMPTQTTMTNALSTAASATYTSVTATISSMSYAALATQAMRVPQTTATAPAPAVSSSTIQIPPTIAPAPTPGATSSVKRTRRRIVPAPAPIVAQQPASPSVTPAMANDSHTVSTTTVAVSTPITTMSTATTTPTSTSTTIPSVTTAPASTTTTTFPSVTTAPASTTNTSIPCITADPASTTTTAFPSTAATPSSATSPASHTAAVLPTQTPTFPVLGLSDPSAEVKIPLLLQYIVTPIPVMRDNLGTMNFKFNVPPEIFRNMMRKNVQPVSVSTDLNPTVSTATGSDATSSAGTNDGTTASPNTISLNQNGTQNLRIQLRMFFDHLTEENVWPSKLFAIICNDVQVPFVRKKDRGGAASSSSFGGRIWGVSGGVRGEADLPCDLTQFIQVGHNTLRIELNRADDVPLPQHGTGGFGNNNDAGKVRGETLPSNVALDLFRLCVELYSFTDASQVVSDVSLMQCLEEEHTIKMIDRQLDPVIRFNSPRAPPPTNPIFPGAPLVLISPQHLELNLHDPITNRRIKIPARGQTCKHISCFDFSSWINEFASRGKYLCPVCGGRLTIDGLRIDKFVARVLREVPMKYSELPGLKKTQDLWGSDAGGGTVRMGTGTGNEDEEIKIVELLSGGVWRIYVKDQVPTAGTEQGANGSLPTSAATPSTIETLTRLMAETARPIPSAVGTSTTSTTQPAPTASMSELATSVGIMTASVAQNPNKPSGLLAPVRKRDGVTRPAPTSAVGSSALQGVTRMTEKQVPGVGKQTDLPAAPEAALAVTDMSAASASVVQYHGVRLPSVLEKQVPVVEKQTDLTATPVDEAALPAQKVVEEPAETVTVEQPSAAVDKVDGDLVMAAVETQSVSEANTITAIHSPHPTDDDIDAMAVDDDIGRTASDMDEDSTVASTGKRPAQAPTARVPTSERATDVTGAGLDRVGTGEKERPDEAVMTASAGTTSEKVMEPDQSTEKLESTPALADTESPSETIIRRCTSPEQMSTTSSASASAEKRSLMRELFGSSSTEPSATRSTSTGLFRGGLLSSSFASSVIDEVFGSSNRKRTVSPSEDNAAKQAESDKLDPKKRRMTSFDFIVKKENRSASPRSASTSGDNKSDWSKRLSLRLNLGGGKDSAASQRGTDNDPLLRLLKGSRAGSSGGSKQTETTSSGSSGGRSDLRSILERLKATDQKRNQTLMDGRSEVGRGRLGDDGGSGNEAMPSSSVLHQKGCLRGDGQSLSTADSEDECKETKQNTGNSNRADGDQKDREEKKEEEGKKDSVPMAASFDFEDAVDIFDALVDQENDDDDDDDDDDWTFGFCTKNK